MSFSRQGSTPRSERTNGPPVDSAGGDFAAIARCGLSRNAKKPTTPAKARARAIAAMPAFKKGSPAIRRLISRTLNLHSQPCYPPRRMSATTIQATERTQIQPNTPKQPFPHPLATYSRHPTPIIPSPLERDRARSALAPSGHPLRHSRASGNPLTGRRSMRSGGLRRTVGTHPDSVSRPNSLMPVASVRFANRSNSLALSSDPSVACAGRPPLAS